MPEAFAALHSLVRPITTARSLHANRRESECTLGRHSDSRRFACRLDARPARPPHAVLRPLMYNPAATLQVPKPKPPESSRYENDDYRRAYVVAAPSGLRAAAGRHK